jgi:hypothetical protein
MKLKNQTNILALYLRMKNPSSFAFYKWQNLFINKQTERHTKHIVMGKMMRTWENFHQRLQKNYILRWKDATVKVSNERKSTLRALVVNMQVKPLQRYFVKWS